MPFTRIEGQLKITKENGDDLDGTEDLSVVSLLPASLFRQVECSVNNTEVMDQATGSFINSIS